MTEGGGWRAFREASRQQVTAATAANELERPAVAHTVSLPSAERPAPKLHSMEPEAPLVTAPPVAEDDTEAEAALPPEASPDEDISPDALHGGDKASKLIADALALFTPKPRDEAGEKTKFGLAHWSVLAIVPVAAAASLLAVRAGLNPYALCLQWWDLLLGTIFLTACLLYLGLAVWKRPKGFWHPGAPALIVAVGVLPFWAGANAAFGSGCQEIPATQPALAPLPPPIEVPSVWRVPEPVPRPPELDYSFNPHQLDLKTPDSVQLEPPRL